MKIVYNKIIPFNRFYAITILNYIFIREEYKKLDGAYVYKKMLNHESIHYEQEKELGFVFFYLLYLLEWFIKLFFFGKDAYHNISFEREAYENEKDFDYIKNRKKYSWLKKIFQKKS